MTVAQVLRELKQLGSPEAAAGMARYGIDSSNAYGVSIPKLRKLAKQIGTDHGLAGELWLSGVHEARILASMIDDPTLVAEAQAESWALDFYSWDVVDQCCTNLFRWTSFAWAKTVEWAGRDEEFVKRAGFTLMATLAVGDKRAPDGDFEALFPLIVREATDERNFVKKAVNWALRQIGKRNEALNAKALLVADEIARLDSRSARWVAKDAIRELSSEAVQERLRKKSGK